VKTKILCVGALTLAAACSSDPERDWTPVGDNLKSDGPDAGRDGGKGSSGPVDVCGKHAVKASSATPDMLIVLDRSGSMAPGGNETRTDRWSGSRDAVVQVTSEFDDSVNFGLMTFPAFNGQSGGRDELNVMQQCVAGSVNVEIQPNAGNAIDRALEPMRAAGYTPTAATLEAALDVIGPPLSADQGLTSPKYILLVTDGDPNCSADFRGVQGNMQVVDPRARTETIAAIERLTKAGVRTYVVGFQTGRTNFAGQLNMMAAAGGTGETEHHSVESGDDLAAVFTELAGRAKSCSFQLAAPVDPTYVLVNVGKEARTYQDQDDGWILGSDKQTVTLTGEACTAAQGGALFEVEVQCDPVIAI
jgi:hypothetical protein